MSDYALTYPQLINQAIALGHGEDDLRRLRATYDLAEYLADGVYRAQSVPLICHFVCAASIVLDERQPVEVAQVAMLHGAYRMSDFRDSRRRKLKASHRALIERTLGSGVERLLFAYEGLPWYSLDAVQEHVRNVAAADSLTRHALFVRLADYLDDHLDHAMAYAGRVFDTGPARAYCEACQELARRLGAPRLAQQIAAAYANNFTVDLPGAVVTDRTRGYERARHHLWEVTAIEGAALNLVRRLYRAFRGRTIVAGETYGQTRPDIPPHEQQNI